MTAASSAAPTLIELDDVAVSRTHAWEDVSVEGVCWQIRAGDYWVVSGLAGAGKSDLLSTAAGLMPPLRGVLRLFGRDVAQLDEDELVRERLRAGIVFAESGRLLQELTLAQNIALPLRYHRDLSDEKTDEEVARILELTNLEPLANRLPGSVGRSGCHRAALARALIMRPEVLFLDEPLRGLDRRETRWWLDMLGELRRGHPLLGRHHLTLAVVTEDLAPWMDHAEKFGLINERRWTLLGNQADVRARSEPLLRELMDIEVAKP